MLAGLFFMLCFFGVRSLDFINKQQQQKLIVYNVPSHTAIDLIEGRKHQFIGDSILQQDGFLKNFHIKPSRILHRLSEVDSLNNIVYHNNFIITKNKTIVVINAPINYVGERIKVDVIIVTKSPKLYINKLVEIFDCKQYIFDGSNSMYKITKWAKDCDSLHLPYHICSQQGAYQMNL
jgi:competence protein ComEC